MESMLNSEQWVGGLTEGGGGMESKVERPCPICNHEGRLMMVVHTDEIPYFGEHTQLTLRCDECGWRHTDFIPVEGRRPGAWSMQLEHPDHLSVRLVRGAHATVRIPELGLEVEPGNHSSGYVSNIEGALERFEGVCEMVFRDLSTDPEQEETRIGLVVTLLDRLARARLADFGDGLTLELIDPAGHSQIMHDDAVHRDLTEQEVADLAMGPRIPFFEADDLIDE